MMCKICKKIPSEIEEYVEAAKEENMTPDDYVREEEGTFNAETGQFYCTNCYVNIWMPLGTA
jgi:hypothetical protein